jgi:hypothetical protein
MVSALLAYLCALSFVDATLGFDAEGLTRFRIAGETLLYREQRMTVAERALKPTAKHQIRSRGGLVWDYELKGLPDARLRVRYTPDPFGVQRVSSWTLLRQGRGDLTVEDVRRILQTCKTSDEAIAQLGLRKILSLGERRQNEIRLNDGGILLLGRDAPVEFRGAAIISRRRNGASIAAPDVDAYACDRCPGVVIYMAPGTITGYIVSASGVDRE